VETTRNSPIMRPWSRNVEEVVAYMSNRPLCRYTNEEIAGIIIPAYFDEGERVGVDPVIAVAQMIHETGFLTSWWCDRPRRNPAGIGVTGQMKPTATAEEKNSNAWAYDPSLKIWKKGLLFANWTEESIPAHIARLLGYAVKKENMTGEQLAYYEEHTARRPLPARVQGCAPTLAGLEGTWAVPGKGYADRLASHCNMIGKK
jgi:hypothetical protein